MNAAVRRAVRWAGLEDTEPEVLVPSRKAFLSFVPWDSPVCDFKDRLMQNASSFLRRISFPKPLLHP